MISKDLTQCPGCPKMLKPSVFKFRETALKIFTPDCPIRDCQKLDGAHTATSDTIVLDSDKDCHG